MSWRIVLVHIRAYPLGYRHLLTQPADPEVGVTTTEDGGW